MKKLQAEDQIGVIAPKEPMSLVEISELEIKFNQGSNFPKAFREYLFLAGKWSGEGVVNNDFEDIREDCDEDMEYWGYSLDRPYFVFDQLDSQYSIFYLDDDKEDPLIYILHPSGKKEGMYPLVRSNHMGTFTQLIDEAIHRVKNNIPF